MRDRQVLIFVSREVGGSVYTAVIGLLQIIAVDHLLSFTPANEIEETLRLHCQLYTALHLHFSKGVGIVAIRFNKNPCSVVRVVSGEHSGTACCAVTQSVN